MSEENEDLNVGAEEGTEVEEPIQEEGSEDSQK